MWTLHSPQSTSQPSPHSPSIRRRSSQLPLVRSVSLNPSISADGDKNQLIQSLCKQGKLKRAMKTLSEQSSSPTQRTYELLIISCTENNSLVDAQWIHRHLLENGFDQDPFLATKLINMYSSMDLIDNARKVFDKTRRRTIYVYNALFQALSLAGYGDEVLNLYRRMSLLGTPRSDRFTYTFALKACCVSTTCDQNTGKEIHAHVLRHGYGRFVHIMTTLVDMYAKFGCVGYASGVFDQMPVKNVVSWSAMIACYAKNGFGFEALELFKRMMMVRTEEAPNSVTMVSVLQACASLAALEQGKLIHGYIVRNQLDSISPVMSALITMYAKCGKLEVAEQVFDGMCTKKDVISWNSLISGYGSHGQGKKALEVFNEMIRCGVSPSPVSFVSVLGACSHANLVDEAKGLFDSMKKEHKMFPAVEHYASMVDILGRANRLQEAVSLIEEMRIEPGRKVWGALLGSCRIHCNVELAEWASTKLFELEPTNAGNYVLLADIYAEAGMWDEVKRIKKMIETRGLRKLHGWSWIEVKKQLHSFVSVDEFNPRMEQLHALLFELSLQMKEKGYVPQTNVVLYDLEEEEKERIVLGHSEKLALAFGLINTSNPEPIRITKNLRLCEDCHSFTKFISKFAGKEILVRDVNRFHHFQDGVCSCGDFW